MSDMADLRELYYEARVYGGAEAADPAGPPQATGGFGARWGGGPAQAIVERTWGRPRWDLRLEYAGYSAIGPIGVRTAAGLVGTRSAARGVPEWTVGPCLDLDIGLTPHFELFVSVLVADRFLRDWEPGHATARSVSGIRWVPGNFGLEIRSEKQFLYEDGATMGVQLAVVGRIGIRLPEYEFSPSTPLAATPGPLIGRSWKRLDLPTDGSRLVFSDETTISLVFADAPVDDLSLNFSRAIIAKGWENTFRNTDNGAFTATYSLDGEVLTLTVFAGDDGTTVSLTRL